MFRATVYAVALSVILITLVIAYELWINSKLSIDKFGFSFLWKSVWDPVLGDYGALPFLYGTVVTTLVALAIAVPLGLAAAIFLSELAPFWLAEPMTFIVELLAAIPSVIYGLMGVFILVPFMRKMGAPYGVGVLTASILLALMIVPFIVSVSKEVLQVVPREQREAALALGATKWETVWVAVLPYARSGIMGSVFLALARAMGETMAVTMVIGNRPEIFLSLFQPGYTMAAVIANEFTEATGDLDISALVEIGLVLFGVTFIINGIARLLIHLTAKQTEVRS